MDFQTYYNYNFVLSITLHVTLKTYEALTITCIFHVSLTNVDLEDKTR